MTLEELIKKCKCGVFLSINEHKDYYDTEEQRIKEINDRDFAQNGQQKDYKPEIDKELADRMIKEKIIVELHFYPDTPIGFYKIYGTSVEEVLEKAEECF